MIIYNCHSLFLNEKLKLGNKLKRAFTLAEVLITVAIIGIVAALTIPAFMNNYQENVNRNKLKNVYSLISEATKQMQADNQNALWCSITCNPQMRDMYYTYMPKAQNNGNVNLWIIGGVYKMYKGNLHVATFALPSITLPDGTILGFFSYPMALSSVKGLTPYSLIYADVQGGKGPKMFGVDTFVFALQKDKNDQLFVYPVGMNGDGTACQTNLPCTSYGDCQKGYGCTSPFMNGDQLP